MATKVDDELFATLRNRGVRKKVAREVATIGGNKSRAGTKGKEVARRRADDLTSAAEEINRRLVRKDRTRGNAALKAADTRSRNSAKRSASAKKAAKTRRAVQEAGSRAKARSQKSSAR